VIVLVSGGQRRWGVAGVLRRQRVSSGGGVGTAILAVKLSYVISGDRYSPGAGPKASAESMSASQKRYGRYEGGVEEKSQI
jgi:hypothetical protein